MEKSTTNIDRVTSFYNWAKDNNEILSNCNDTIKSFSNTDGLMVYRYNFVN